MAIEEWETLKEDERKSVYSKDGGKTGLMVYPDSKMINGEYKIYKWNVLKQTKKRKYFRSFKTKAQALAYANQYMRTH